MAVVVAPGFFDQIGLTNIVWLDNLFDAKAAPSLTDIAEEVAVALAAGSPVNHPKLRDLTNEDSPQEWARLIQERLDYPEREAFLTQIRQPESGGARQVSDYSASEIETVVSSLGGKIRRVGLTTWPEVKEDLIASTQSGVFLVDRELPSGGERINVGDDIVQELVERCGDEVFVMVLTHSLGPEGVGVLKNELAEELNIPVYKFGVVSKRPEGSRASLADSVRAAVRLTLTQSTCAVVTDRIVRVMQESLTRTALALTSLPVEALDRAVFENSFLEGASELDVLSRILTSRQRTAVDVHIAGTLDDVHSLLVRMRKLRDVEPLPPQPPADTDVLAEWRRDEVFDDGSRLNPLRSPIACGDVFVKEGTRQHYVMLGQPCDLVVRPNGNRSAHEAVLVKFISPYTPTAGVEGRYLELPALEGSERWALDFRNWASVNLECLEWASFNNDGKLAFAPVPEPPIGLLPGWEKRFIKARSKFRQGRQYCLSLGGIANKVAEATADSVQFPYRRVARLRGARASSAYAAFAAFHARGAFDHDFAKGLGTPPQGAPTTTQKPTLE